MLWVLVLFVLVLSLLVLVLLVLLLLLLLLVLLRLLVLLVLLLVLFCTTTTDPASTATTSPRLLKYKGWLVRLAPSPNAVWIAAGCNDNTVRLWRRATGQELQCGGYSSKITGLCWTASSRYLATSGGNQVTIDHARIRYVGKSQSCMVVLQVIDELFREISEGLEVQVDQAQLEAKLRAAVESVRSDFDQV